MTPRERWTLDPEELPNWLLKRFEDPRILDAIQLAQLRQTASGINLSQLGITPQDFVSADLIMQQNGLTVHEGLEITGPAPVLEGLLENIRQAGIPVETEPIDPPTNTPLKVMALIDHLRAEALRKEGKLISGDVRVKEIVVIDVNN